MATSQPTGPALRQAIEELANNDRFGDSRRIIGLATEAQYLIHDVLSQHAAYPPAEAMTDPDLRHVLVRHPAIRAALEKSWRALRAGAPHSADQLAGLVSAAAGHVGNVSGQRSPSLPAVDPHVACPSLRGTDVGPIDVVVEESLGSDLGAAFGSLAEQALREDDPELRIIGASEAQLTRLQDAVDLIEATIPELGPGTLDHSALICLVDGPAVFQSASMRRVPRTVFLSQHAFRHVVTTADALFHESLHLKLYDLYLVSPLLAAGYEPEASPLVESTWNAAPGNAWQIDRSLGAFHVYVHLSAFYAAMIEQTGDPSPAWMYAAYENSGRRAHHLHQELLDKGADSLSAAGTAFVRWLGTQLALLDDGGFANSPAEPVVAGLE